MQKAENFLKGIFIYKCVKVFSSKVKSYLGGVKGKMKKSGKDMNRVIQHSGGHVSGNRGASRINGLKGLSSKRLSSFVLTAISVVSVFVTVALLTTGTVEAQVAPNPTFVTVNVSPSNPPTIPADQITIGWSTGQVQKGNHSIHVNTTAATPDYAMVGVPTDFILQCTTQISYWGYTAGGDVNAPDEIFLFLDDTDNDGEVDVILGNHWGPPGTGSWQQWNMSKGSWFRVVDPRTGVTIPANISDYCDKGYKVLGVAIGAGSPESYPTGGVTVDVYLDNLTIDVDGDGNLEYTLDDDTGTIEVFCETINGTTYCASIQDAINAALPGDTILVAAGLYNITKPASEYADILVNKENLTLKAMNPAATLADPWDPSEASIIVASGNVANVVNIAADGVTFDGFTLSGDEFAAVFGINIYDWIDWKLYNNCVVKNNYITNCSCGILAAGDDHNISNNICNSNELNGINIYNSDNVTIKDNICVSNGFGIYLWSSNVIFIVVVGGIGIVDSANVTIEDNTCDSNGYGIYLNSSSDIVIRFNTLSNNTAEDSGVHVGSGCEDILISFNNIYGNSPYGVYNDPSNSLVNATHNWWGDASGPGPVGSGDNVSDNVAYEPWLGAPLELPGHYETLSAGTHTVDASSEADTKVTLNLTGDTEIYVAIYESQPFPDEPFPDEALGKWIDIHVSDPDNVTWPIYVEVTYTDAEVAAAGIDESTLGLYYYKVEDTFHRCSDTGVNIAENFIWAKVNKTEAMGLVGKEFGAGGNPIPERVPALTPIGIIALITILSVVLAVATMKRKKANNQH